MRGYLLIFIRRFFVENHLDVETDEYMLKSMKRQYPFGFEMAAIAADYIADIYNLSMKENDLIYLAIHFQAAIERIILAAAAPK